MLALYLPLRHLFILSAPAGSKVQCVTLQMEEKRYQSHRRGRVGKEARSELGHLWQKFREERTEVSFSVGTGEERTATFPSQDLSKGAIQRAQGRGQRLKFLSCRVLDQQQETT